MNNSLSPPWRRFADAMLYAGMDSELRPRIEDSSTTKTSPFPWYSMERCASEVDLLKYQLAASSICPLLLQCDQIVPLTHLLPPTTAYLQAVLSVRAFVISHL